MVDPAEQLAAAGALRAVPGDHRQGHRHAAREVRPAQRHPRAHRGAAGPDPGEGKALATPRVTAERKPWFCSGCPHNTSTNVPEGSRALAGIGCHYMTVWMDRNTSTFSQMGGEGVAWIGQAPFAGDKHVFANLGDGTYFHRPAGDPRVDRGRVNITYKILYNDAVAMTGGQPVDGQLSVQDIARQVAAEGAKKIVIVTDEPEKYNSAIKLPRG
jgi:indolepyruvate ferredoxin oxidoreductase